MKTAEFLNHKKYLVEVFLILSYYWKSSSILVT